tara:strand:+ start:970 stop:1158 length:189 start_codon:yes stop_codon:yes gene_type:complete
VLLKVEQLWVAQKRAVKQRVAQKRAVKQRVAQKVVVQIKLQTMQNFKKKKILIKSIIIINPK